MTTPGESDAALSDLSWAERAACRDQPPECFIDPQGPDDINHALNTCHSCPVRPTCLHTALSHAPDVDVGIWGGTTEQTRQGIRAGKLTAEDALHPAVSLTRDRYGDLTDPTGRVLIFELHGQPPYMLLVDRRPIQRTHSVKQAAQLAWDILHGHRRTFPTGRARA